MPIDRGDDLGLKDAPSTLTMVAARGRGMIRTRLSTTVDADLLADARRVRSGLTDAALVDEALQALLASATRCRGGRQPRRL